MNLNLINVAEFNQTQASKHAKVPLESIAEDTETQNPATRSATTATTTTTSQNLSQDDTHKSRLSPLHRLSLQSGSRDSVSPVPSEANASIDLTCDTPPSASIDISDHNIKPTERMAAVLHHTTPSSPLISVDESTNARNDTPPSPPAPAVGSPDSAEAAAIRIQSAFRGYKTRKHSPYRRRSPSGTTTTSSSNGTTIGTTKRNAFKQQDATMVDDDDTADMQQQPTSIKDEDEGIVDDDAAQLVQAQETGRRPSRQRQRDASEANVADDQRRSQPEGQTNISDTSVGTKDNTSAEEFTATEDSTVREVLPTQQQQQPSSNGSLSMEAEHGTSNGRGSLDAPTLADGQGEASLSIDQAAFGQSLSSMLDETGLSGVQEIGLDGVSIVSQANLTTNEDAPALSLAVQAKQRPSLGAKSDGGLSIELDTDSSNLGAALSLNDEPSEHLQLQSTMQHTRAATLDSNVDEDKSLGTSLIGEELASEARRLVDELAAGDEEQDEEDSSKQQEVALDEATNLLESALEEATEEPSIELPVNETLDSNAENQLVTSALTEEKQRAIELESDDIERRDPRGQASEERAKSPQIKTEQPSLIGSFEEALGSQEEAVAIDDSGHNENQRLTIESPDEAIASGRSSPALNSSKDATSSDEVGESDQEGGNEGNLRNKTENLQQQLGQNQGGSGGKKKRNRNKRKGRK